MPKAKKRGGSKKASLVKSKSPLPEQPGITHLGKLSLPRSEPKEKETKFTKADAAQLNNLIVAFKKTEKLSMSGLEMVTVVNAMDWAIKKIKEVT